MNRSTTAILIVDDDKSITETLTAILQSEGYVTASAASAKEALERVTTQPFDLVLLDIKLPDKEGTQLLTDLRKITPETIQIIITGYPSIKSATEALNGGAALYLTKPFDPDDLLEAIRSKLEEEKQKERITGKKIVEYAQQRARRAQFTDFQEFSERIADEFAPFGLTKTQAKIYVGLSALGVASASEIAALSKIRREEVYRTIPELEKRGLLTRRFGVPRRFSAIEPDAALSILIRTRVEVMSRETESLEQKKGELISQLGKIALRIGEEGHSVEMLSQQDSVLVKLAGVTQKARSQLVAAVAFDQFGKTFLGQLKGIVSNDQSKVNARVAVEKSDSTGSAWFSEFRAHERKRFELRRVEALPFSLIIADDREAIWGEPYPKGENTEVLWTNCQTQIALLKMAFENLWEQSQP